MSFLSDHIIRYILDNLTLIIHQSYSSSVLLHNNPSLVAQYTHHLSLITSYHIISMAFFRSIGRSARQKKEQPGTRPAVPQLGNNHQQITQNNASQHLHRPLYLCQPFVRTALVKGSFATIVVLPKYIEHGEWLALNVFEFFTYLNNFYSVVTESCTSFTCPSMSAGQGLDYTWLDQNRKQMRLPAPQYIDYVLAWINNRINEEALFPTKIGSAFGTQFLATVKAIYKQMFRIFAHIYHAHFDVIVNLSLEGHWNSFFQHFISFGREFELLDGRDIEPLKDLIVVFQQQGNIA